MLKYLCILAALCFAIPASADLTPVQAEVLVPHEPKKTLVPIELLWPASGEKAAFGKLMELKIKLARDFHPEGAGDQFYYLGKCFVLIRQSPDAREKLVYYLECISNPMWDGDSSFQALVSLQDSDAVIQEIYSFMNTHAKRTARPVPKPKPTGRVWTA